MIEANRRSFLAGLGAALITAPAIVRAGSLMPVRQMIWDTDEIAALLNRRLDQFEGEQDDRLYARYDGRPLYYDPIGNRWVKEDVFQTMVKTRQLPNVFGQVIRA